MRKKQYIEFVLTCLSNNLLSLAQPIIEKLDKESITILVKNSNSKSLQRLLEYLAEHLENAFSKNSLSYMFFMNQIIIYKLEEVRKQSNKRFLRRILQALNFKVKDVLVLSEEVGSLAKFIESRIS